MHRHFKPQLLQIASLRNLCQSRIFADIDLSYNVEWKGHLGDKGNAFSLVDGFQYLLQSSPRIASYVRGISFLWDAEKTTFELDAKKGLAAAHSIVELTKNLKRIWFPITNYHNGSEHFPSWEDFPKTLRTKFLEFYRRPSTGTWRHINILGVRDFPAVLLITIPGITELSIMPLGFKEEEIHPAEAAATVSTSTQGPYNLEALRLHYYSQEHSFFNWKATMQFLQLSICGQARFNVKQLTDLQFVCGTDDMPEFAPENYIHMLYKPCSHTLKSLTLRLNDQDSLYTNKRWGKSRAIMKPASKMQIDLSKLAALQSLSIHFSIDQALSEDDEETDQPGYKTHVPWVANVLKTVIKSSAFSKTLSSITLTVSLGKWSNDYGNYFPTDEDMSLVDWSDITKVLSQKPQQSKLKVIKIKFMAHVAEGKCAPLKEDEVKVAYNDHLRKLQEKTGILVVE